MTVGGRVVFIRNTGKLAFATLQDGFTPGDNGERLQVMLSLAEVGEQASPRGVDVAWAITSGVEGRGDLLQARGSCR